MFEIIWGESVGIESKKAKKEGGVRKSHIKWLGRGRGGCKGDLKGEFTEIRGCNQQKSERRGCFMKKEGNS